MRARLEQIMVVAILSFSGIFHSCELHAFERRPSLARTTNRGTVCMHRPCRGFRRGIDGGDGGGGGGRCCPCGSGGGSGVAAGKCRELVPPSLPSAPRFWTIHREDVEKFLRINCLVLQSSRYRKELANLVKHWKRRGKSNPIHSLRMKIFFIARKR